MIGSKPSPIADRLLIAGFLTAIGVVPVAACLSRPDAGIPLREARFASPPPSLPTHYGALRQTPGKVEQFFNDRLPGRDELLTWRAELKLRTLGVSPSERVIVGEDGWLFLDLIRPESGPARDAAEQARLWAAAIRARRAWCADRGIAYLLVRTPEKQSVYREYLPAALRHPRTPTAAERLIAALRAAGDVTIVDLQPALERGKADGPVYFRTDTHWNSAGGYCAYRAIAEALGFAPLGREMFDSKREQFSGDLNRMLRVADPAPESVERLELHSPRARVQPLEIPAHAPADRRPVAIGTCDNAQPRGVLFHDSFAPIVLLPALAEHFDLLAAERTPYFDEELVERVRPAVVIQQIVERKIAWLPAGRGP